MSQPTEIEVMISNEAPTWLLRAMLHLEHQMHTAQERITQIMSQQDQLNTLLGQMNDDLKTVIAELKSQAGANTILDFSGLDSFAASLHATATASEPVATSTGTPSTPGTPSETTASTPPDTTTSSPAAGTGQATVAGPFYVYRGSNLATVDTTQWTQTDLETTDARPLFKFTGDTPGGDATGQSADWEVYAGPTQQAAPATAPANEPSGTPGTTTTATAPSDAGAPAPSAPPSV